eukprot:227451_1
MSMNTAKRSERIEMTVNNTLLTGLKEDDTHYDNDRVAFDKDLYHFYILFSLKYPTINLQFITISLLSLIELAIQFVFLYAFSDTFIDHFAKQFIAKTTEIDYIKSGDVVNLDDTYGTIHLKQEGKNTNNYFSSDNVMSIGSEEPFTIIDNYAQYY